jgi:hypothetical protein
MDLSVKHQPLPVCQQVTHSTLDLLAAVVAAFFPAHPGHFDQLAVDYACTGTRGFTPSLHTPIRAGGVRPLPGAVDAPGGK